MTEILTPRLRLRRAAAADLDDLHAMLGDPVAMRYWSTLPHVVGTAIGLGTMLLAVAAGVGVLVGAFPVLALGLKVVGSLYVLVLAYQVAGGHALRRADVVRDDDAALSARAGAAARDLPAPARGRDRGGGGIGLRVFARQSALREAGGGPVGARRNPPGEIYILDS